MTTERGAGELQAALDYTFKNKQLLKEALSHPSCAADENYERLEFLGDAVIELCCSLYLFARYPKAGEGELTRRRASLVRGDALEAAARRIGLGRHIYLGRGEESSGGREKKSVLENAAEALLGAVYLDGGMRAADRIARALIFEPQALRADTEADYKSLLQEKLQARGAADISYVTFDTEGPPHDAVFHVRLYLNGKPAGEGRGKSKKQAEQEAAKAALSCMN